MQYACSFYPRTKRKNLLTRIIQQPPPAYYTIYPRDTNQNSNAAARPGQQPAAPAMSKKPPTAESLISRYDLEDRLAKPGPAISEEEIGGKAVWEDTAEKREASLRERKAQMILAARQCVIVFLCRFPALDLIRGLRRMKAQQQTSGS